MNRLDGKLLAELLEEYASALELFARQHCQCPADVVQEAFIQLARQIELPDNIVGWLYRVVRNGAISAARADQRRRKHESVAAARNWFQSSPADRIDALSAADELARLPVEQREVVVAHLWGGLSFEQIAALTDSSSSTAHRRYQSALETLRQTLGVSCLTPKTARKI